MVRPSGAAPGTLFAGRYQVERELGRGGMAVVYLAHDTRNSRPVALKVLRREVAAVLGPERFQREIEVAASLNHPNILPLYDSDQVGGDLHYVMPYVASGTLADRLATGPRIGVAEALEIARQTAAGLAYAHQRGIVHRDIKPANLLLADGHVFIADFGIARALRQAATTGHDLTESGLVVGTPAYMAPEQVRGASQVDGRADEFSLAAVLHEMLTGEPPHTDSHRPGVLHKALRRAGRRVPPGVERALVRALAIDPAERFASAAEFAAALDAGRSTLLKELGQALSRGTRREWTMIGGLALLLSGALWWSGRNHPPDVLPVPDTTRVALLPFEDPGPPGAPSLNPAQQLRTAMLRWDGITPADPVRVREASARHGSGRLSRAAAIAVSRAVGAGQYIRGTIERGADSLRLTALLYRLTPTGDTLLFEHSVPVEPGQAGEPAAFAELADWLLFRGAPPAGGARAMGTGSLPAWQAYQHAMAMIHQWRLDSADVFLTQATTVDTGFARASLWLAVVRSWNGAEPAQWRFAAERAAKAGGRVEPLEGAMADALIDMADGRFERACARWRSLTRQAPQDFAVWYGTGQCEVSDSAVVSDRRSPSGWRFRTSYHSALQAYRRAFALLPSLLGAFRGDAYASARGLLYTRGTQYRRGRALPPDTISFVAEPAWVGDSLSMVPYPAGARPPRERATLVTARQEAIRHQRELFRDLALTWAALLPRSADAREALASAMELLGDPAALDTIRNARALATTDAERVRVMGAEAWMRARLALPDQPAGLRAARALAESLLARPAGSEPPEPGLLASLAMLTGHPSRAAALSRVEATVAGWDVAGGVALHGAALLAFAAGGGPADSVRPLVRQVEQVIERAVPPAGRQDARLEWLGRPVTLAFPDVRLDALGALVGQGDPLADLLAAADRGDTAVVVAGIARTDSARSDPADVTFDTLFPECWALAAVGHPAEAARRLDATLARAGERTARGIELTVHAGSLVRAMALRAELAARSGDRETARRWARAVVALWDGGEAAVQPLVARMRALAA